MSRNVAWLVTCCALAGAVAPAAADDEASPLGRHVEQFTLKDFRGKQHSLSD